MRAGQKQQQQLYVVARVAADREVAELARLEEANAFAELVAMNDTIKQSVNRPQKVHLFSDLVRPAVYAVR